jgi:hypothetical protein
MMVSPQCVVAELGHGQGTLLAASQPGVTWRPASVETDNWRRHFAQGHPPRLVGDAVNGRHPTWGLR